MASAPSMRRWSYESDSGIIEPRLELAVHEHRLGRPTATCRGWPPPGTFTIGVKYVPPMPPEIADREAAALHVLERQLAGLGLLRQLRQVGRDLDDVLLVDVAKHGHEQAELGVDRDADVHVLLVDDLLVVDVDRRVELREHRCPKNVATLTINMMPTVDMTLFRRTVRRVVPTAPDGLQTGAPTDPCSRHKGPQSHSPASSFDRLVIAVANQIDVRALWHGRSLSSTHAGSCGIAKNLNETMHKLSARTVEINAIR